YRLIPSLETQTIFRSLFQSVQQATFAIYLVHSYKICSFSHPYKFWFIDEIIISFFVPYLNPFFFVYCGAKFVLRKDLTFGVNRVTIQQKRAVEITANV
ncbi:MAG: hypothetical protein IKL13_06795, partial [Clostridia bacterium]|nr:hypothetical protein [Clostridia bacterium]